MTTDDAAMTAWLAEVEATAARLNQWAIDGCPGGTGGTIIELDRAPGESLRYDGDAEGRRADEAAGLWENRWGVADRWAH